MTRVVLFGALLAAFSARAQQPQVDKAAETAKRLAAPLTIRGGDWLALVLCQRLTSTGVSDPKETAIMCGYDAKANVIELQIHGRNNTVEYAKKEIEALRLVVLLFTVGDDLLVAENTLRILYNYSQRGGWSLSDRKEVLRFEGGKYIVPAVSPKLAP